jgi:hypothetical protein
MHVNFIKDTPGVILFYIYLSRSAITPRVAVYQKVMNAALEFCCYTGDGDVDTVRHTPHINGIPLGVIITERGQGGGAAGSVGGGAAGVAAGVAVRKRLSKRPVERLVEWLVERIQSCRGNSPFLVFVHRRPKKTKHISQG